MLDLVRRVPNGEALMDLDRWEVFVTLDRNWIVWVLTAGVDRVSYRSRISCARIRVSLILEI
jgi:hypothetical protein